MALATFVLRQYDMTIADAWAAFEAQDYTTAEKIAVPLLESSDSATNARFLLGYVYAFTGRFAEARAAFQRLREQARQARDLEAEHRALHQVGMVERMAGNWEAASRCFLAERELIDRLPDNTLAVSVNAYEVATMALHFGQWLEAGQEYEKCLQYAQKSGDRVAVACAFRGLGDLSEREGNGAKAREHWLKAQMIFEELGDGQGVKEIEERLGG